VRLPPRLVRRLVLAPLFIVATLFVVGTVPLSLLIAAFASRYVPGRWRPLRLIWFVAVWMVFESLVLVALFGLWLVSGFGWKLDSPGFQDVHYRLMGWFLRRVVGSARFTFGLETVADVPPEPDEGVRPLLVFARHAGPGDSLLLIDALLNRFDRHPRIVLKDVLQWDPAVDIALNRLPSRFISTRTRPGEAAVQAIAALSATLGPRDALVIFPEGGNFTSGRREKAIEKLAASGLEEYAERARAMERLLPPKPGGVLAAVQNAPDAVILLVGHAGLEDMDTIRQVWSGMKMDITLHTRMWSAYVSDLPRERRELEVWLYDRWAEMNDWLTTVGDELPDA
jgi:1-acyl-sn-glycerol-3-phosphate acyltransferase